MSLFLVVAALALAGCDYVTWLTGLHTPNVDATGVTDVSSAMAAFLASVPDGSTIDLASNGRYRMESTLVIDGRHDLTIRGHGATFVATSQGDQMRANVRVLGSSNITITDLKVVGANPLAGAKDRIYHAEFGGQHGFDIDSSRHVSLLRVSATDTYGDFVYIGGRDGFPQSDDVIVRDSFFARSGRQGITLTSANAVAVTGTTITEPKRSMFDFEPGRDAGNSLTNVLISGNTLSKGPLLFVAAEGHGGVDHVTIQDNRLTDMNLGVALEDLDGGVRYDWKILDNTANYVSGNPYGATMRFWRIDGLVVTGNYQPMKPDRDMVLVGATDSCGVTVAGNTLPNSVAQFRTTGTC
jgi:hypothetical protein